MRVVLASDSYAPVLDGVAVCVAHYARYMRSAGDECIVVAPHGGRDPMVHGRLRALWASSQVGGDRPATRRVGDRPEPAEGEVDARERAGDPSALNLPQDEPDPVRFASFELPGFAPYRAGAPTFDIGFHHRLREELQRVGGVDVVHTHTPFAAGSEARRIARHFEAPLIGTFHSKYRNDFEAAGLHGIGRDFLIKRVVAYYESCDEVWAPNEATAGTLKEYGFRGDINIVANGTDFAPVGRAERHVLRAEGEYLLKAPKGVPLLLYVGQLRWEKNIDGILGALSVLRDRHIPFYMVFVGSGRDERAILRAVEKQKLTQSVQFYGRVADRRRLRAIYARSDLLLFPSTYDNAPLVVREAAACGCPSILTAGSNAASDTLDGVNALHARGDFEGIADALIRAISDPNLVADLGERAKSMLSLPWADAVAKARERYQALSSIST